MANCIREITNKTPVSFHQLIIRGYKNNAEYIIRHSGEKGMKPSVNMSTVSEKIAIVIFGGNNKHLHDSAEKKKDL